MIRVYRYGLRRPTTNADLVDDQMRLGNRYYNRLIEIECARRDAIREAMADNDRRHGLSDAIARHARLDEQYNAAKEALKAKRSRARCRVDTAPERAAVRDLRAQRSKAAAELKEARKGHRGDSTMHAAFDAANEEAKLQRRASRAICGVYWGTYLQIEAAVDQAAKETSLFFKGKPRDPRFRRWGGSVMVATQLQGGLLALSALACDDSRLQIEMAELGPGPHSRRQLKLRKGTLRLRVGSDGRSPIWAEWPLQMHRPLPENGVIKWAKVIRRMVSDRDKWELQLTVEISPEQPCHGEGTVAVDLGWRRKEDGTIRVGYVVDDCGLEEEIILDPGVVSGLRKSEDLRSIQDKAQAEMAARVIGWLKAQAELPPWLILATGFVDKWKSARRWRRLASIWAEHPDVGSEALSVLSAWAADSLHLWRWEAHQRRKSCLRRKDQYRCLAKRLAAEYRHLVLESKFLAKLQRHVEAEDEDVEIKAVRLQQRDAAGYELKQCLIYAFRRANGTAVEVDPAMTTQRCNACGFEGRWDAAVEIDHTCEACGATWDQDANACRNLLERERPGDDSGQEAKRQGKWARKKAAKRTARKTVPSGAESFEAGV